MTQQIVRSGLRLTKDLNQNLTKIAREIGMTKNQLMVHILFDWVKEQQKKQGRDSVKKAPQRGQRERNVK